VTEIAAASNVGSETIRRALHRLGVPLRSPGRQGGANEPGPERPT
jgi:hypothetical protein